MTEACLTKICPRCELEKDISEFNRRGEDGVSSYCTQCMCEYSAERFQKDAHVKLKQRYKLTVDDYLVLAAEQGGRCAVCGTVPETKLFVDHDHRCCSGEITCGECVRGLLCASCNRGLGNFGDSPEALEAAAAYLRRWSS